MSHPSGGYTVHTNELRDEARVWDQQGEELGRIVGLAEGLRTDRLSAGIFQIFVTAYGPVIDQVTARCREGQHCMDDIADALLAVARGYGKAEAEGEALFRERF
jgi:hypothetical protein